MMTELNIMIVPITGLIGCSVPVVPGTPDIDAAIEHRTELCAVDANWIVGSAPTCDTHLKVVCEMTGIDWSGVVAEAGRDLGSAERPWGERQRHTQAEAREHRDHFGHAATLGREEQR